MTPEDRDRVTRLEERDSVQNARLAAIEAKLDKLLQTAAVGQGAFWAILKVGGMFVAILGAGAAVATIIEKTLNIVKH